ncbi:MAG: hypothetical protein CSA35_05095 [Dethiosulfovibrio peptidovorans]|nr:MAG: hypothetical protein CSA35_05095 [Dethiosulfovibrio peptidovorans]
MFKKILYPTDLSERSERDLRWVSSHLYEPGEEFIVAHGVDVAVGMETPSVVSQAGMLLQELCERAIPPSVAFQCRIRAGGRDEAVPAIAKEENCSMVIVTSSPTAPVVPIIQSLAIPQLILRWENLPTVPGELLKSVVVATDLEEERTTSVLQGLRSVLAVLDKSDHHPRITVLHGVPMTETQTAHQVFNQASKALELLRIDVESWNGQAESQLVGGQTEEELPQAIVELNTSLLVLGLPSRGDVWQLLLSNTAEALVERTKCPILIVPTD